MCCKTACPRAFCDDDSCLVSGNTLFRTKLKGASVSSRHERWWAHLFEDILGEAGVILAEVTLWNVGIALEGTSQPASS